MESSRDSSEEPTRKRPPATTPEARENQMIALAFDAAEKQMREGTASAMVITHYLKLGTTRARLEEEKLRKENTLLEAKAAAIESAKHVETLYAEALSAMRSYQGQEEEEVD